MRLGISFGYQDWGAGLPGAIAMAQEADRLGYESGWVAEAYGTWTPESILPPASETTTTTGAETTTTTSG